jgi:hypothetical protein
MTEVQTTQNDALAALPEKFRDPETGAVRIEALVNSYLELERKLSSMIPAPGEDGESRMRVLRALGVPETPDAYEVDVSHGLFDVDDTINCRLHEKGFTPEQVQEVYNLAAEKMVPALLEMTRELQADREVERLVSAFGGPEKWREVSRQLLAYGKKTLPPEVLGSLACSFEGVMALYRMMQAQEPGMAIRQADNAATQNEGDLRALMRDPRYWREKDPSFVAQVTSGFQRMYGEN